MKKILLTLALMATVTAVASANVGDKKKKSREKAKTEQTDKKEGCSEVKSCCSKKPATEAAKPAIIKD